MPEAAGSSKRGALFEESCVAVGAERYGGGANEGEGSNASANGTSQNNSFLARESTHPEHADPTVAFDVPAGSWQGAEGSGGNGGGTAARDGETAAPGGGGVGGALSLDLADFEVPSLNWSGIYK